VPSQSSLNQGQHLLGHQDHRTTPEIAIRPILARIEQRAEASDLGLEGEQLVGDTRRRPMDDQAITNELESDLVVRLVAVGLEQFDPPILLQLGV
jgi:hypothetical protein